ncbi:hypothetical protein VB773_12925 [Haloarculaceae archaeon H-GB2-1]|nr:hypothetical protein [Haloarculaceae archaeon H-GB1-1]MEA5386895.1 hypothetical protein [Haloarculaceae archaeon H-GB11]MEA5408375.1 hypothetical protein [Haloarculaceae archaeon H-GB2-1]
MIERTLPATTYRRVDHASKLAGVALVAAGMEAGGGTPEGIALALLGAVLATCTVFIQTDQ